LTPGAAPLELDDVLDPAWLSRALGRPVHNVTEVWRQVNMATKIRLDVDGEALCIKGYFGAPAGQVRLGGREARFYAELASTLPIDVPPLRHAGIDEATGHGVVVMEDLVAAGATFLTARSPYTPDQVSATLDQLAALHAATWDAPRLEALPWVASQIETYVDVIDDAELGELLAGPRGEGIPDEVRDARRVKRGLLALARRHAGHPACVDHCDAHAGNLYEWPDGRVGIIDWATYQLVHWSFDVAYHIGAVLEPDVRAATERDLLAHYLDRRAGRGVASPSFEEAWEDYRCALAYGYFMWAITRRVEEDVMLTFNRRLGTAVAEHRSYELLDV